ncbi:MAG: tetratricopeptide repeat protein, partial [Thermoanaerobaculia bacterium]
PTPQLSLQLAEEYRRHGRLEEGMAILEEALRLHPSHVAGRVAHGRFLLELGRTEDAGQMLEAVVEEDPTHLVANKLLIGLYLETDRLKDARDRLDLYKLLNESDPAIEVLELRLRSAGAAGAQPTAVDAAGRVFVLTGSPPLPDLQSLVAQKGPTGLSTRPRSPASEGPFGDLWQGVDEVEYMRALGAEGIFPVVVPVVIEEPGVELAAPIEAVEPPEIEPVIEVEPVVQKLADEPAEPQAIVDTAELDEEAPGQEIGATATLAKLYLDQGHLEDAAHAFEEVLAREPEHLDALEGLTEARRRLGETQAAEGILDGETENDTGNRRDRKVRVLREYLDRLRAASGRQ